MLRSKNLTNFGIFSKKQLNAMFAHDVNTANRNKFEFASFMYVLTPIKKALNQLHESTPLLINLNPPCKS